MLGFKHAAEHSAHNNGVVFTILNLFIVQGGKEFLLSIHCLHSFLMHTSTKLRIYALVVLATVDTIESFLNN